MTDEMRGALEESALKKATGYTAVETQEEYSLVDGDLALVKRKVIQKDVAPDLSAIRWLLGERDSEQVSMAELEIERELLLKEYSAIGEENKKIREE